jgi:hypothetical protein
MYRVAFQGAPSHRLSAEEALTALQDISLADAPAPEEEPPTAPAQLPHSLAMMSQVRLTAQLCF